MHSNEKKTGIIFAGLAATLWAISGISGEILFTHFGFSAEWLVSVRMFVAGVLLLLASKLTSPHSIFSPFKQRRDFLAILVFSILGMYAVQYTYFKTIELSSASFATIIQYTGPFFIIIYEAIRAKILPNRKTLLLMLLTLTGVFLIVSNGDISQLTITPISLLWGIGSAISLAFYSVQPRNILKQYGSLLVVGWGMLIGSMPANLIQPFWQTSGILSFGSLIHVSTVIILGTAVSYFIYLSSLKYISSSLASILTAFEPIFATFLSIPIFHTPLTLATALGFFIVLGTILLLQKVL
ncbi:MULTISPECIES: DMT family transporter [unclassified Enterococcus]|uniref:DMT family transporter n=1 Tax=unclassified Enterococcus TaxID=2608891 RepID=UPI003D274042